MCHYCKHIEHIRPHCFQYLADLRRMGNKKPQSQRSTTQVWVKKSDLHCNIAHSSSKAVANIRINENIFCGKHEVGVQGNLDLSGEVVSDVSEEVFEDAPKDVSKDVPRNPQDVLASTVDTSRCDRIDLSTTQFHARGAKESSKDEKNGRIPPFLVFLCLLLAKRRSTC